MKTKSVAAVLALAVVTGGCVQATKQPSPNQISPVPADRVFTIGDQSADAGSAVVTRDVGLAGGGCFLGLYIDGQPAAHFDPGERTTFKVKPGRHVLTARYVGGRGLCAANSEARQVARSHSTEVLIDPGMVRAYRIHTRVDGEPSIEPTL